MANLGLQTAGEAVPDMIRIWYDSFRFAEAAQDKSYNPTLVLYFPRRPIHFEDRQALELDRASWRSSCSNLGDRVGYGHARESLDCYERIADLGRPVGFCPSYAVYRQAHLHYRPCLEAQRPRFTTERLNPLLCPIPSYAPWLTIASTALRTIPKYL